MLVQFKRERRNVNTLGDLQKVFHRGA